MKQGEEHVSAIQSWADDDWKVSTREAGRKQQSANLSFNMQSRAREAEIPENHRTS